MKVTLLALLGVALSTPAVGQPRYESPGAQTCSTFLRKAGPTAMADMATNAWVSGYLTGRIEGSPDASHPRFVGLPAVMEVIAKYCRAARGTPGIEPDVDVAVASLFDKGAQGTLP